MTDTAWRPGDLAEMHDDEPGWDLPEGTPVTVTVVDDEGWINFTRDSDGQVFTTADLRVIRPRG